MPARMIGTVFGSIVIVAPSNSVHIFMRVPWQSSGSAVNSYESTSKVSTDLRSSLASYLFLDLLTEYFERNVVIRTYLRE